MYNWPRSHSALLLSALAIKVTVPPLISCVYCRKVSLARVRVCARAQKCRGVCVCVCSSGEIKRGLSLSFPSRVLLSEFGRGSPGGPCRSNGLLLIALIQVRNIGFNDV